MKRFLAFDWIFVACLFVTLFHPYPLRMQGLLSSTDHLQRFSLLIFYLIEYLPSHFYLLNGQCRLSSSSTIEGKCYNRLFGLDDFVPEGVFDFNLIWCFDLDLLIFSLERLSWAFPIGDSRRLTGFIKSIGSHLSKGNLQGIILFSFLLIVNLQGIYKFQILLYVPTKNN